MKLVKAVLLSAALIGATAPGTAKADNFGWGLLFGTLVAAPLIASAHYGPYYYGPYGYGPYYGYAPAYYPQPTYVQPPAPAVQQPVQPAYSWYFCPGSNGYYPYVSTCPGGWQPVSPVPPGMQ